MSSRTTVPAVRRVRLVRDVPYGAYAPYYSTTRTGFMQHMQQNTFDIKLLRRLCLVYMKAYLNASEVAKLLKVDRATVSRWLKKGLIKGAISPSDGHQWRVPLDAVDKLIKETKQS